MALATIHVMNLCLASSSTTVQKKHVPFEIRLRFKAIAKSTHQQSHVKETPWHGTEDETAILHPKLYATTLHVK